MEKAPILIEILWKTTDLSVGAGRERLGMEKASILIEILWKTNGFDRWGGPGVTGDGKSFNF